MKKPIIGITLDREDVGGYSPNCNWYAIRTNYAKAVMDANAVPIMIPYDKTSINQYVDIIDGLIVTGGDYDLDPKHYNEKKSTLTRNQKEARVEFELDLIHKAMTKNIPILGICAGHQLIGVKLGDATLYQDINNEYDTDIEHEQTKLNIPHNLAVHNVIINKDSKLYKIMGTSKLKVNSTHHQAIKSINDDFIICAKSSDGLIEAIEHKYYPFLIGVIWHPEYQINQGDKNIFIGLVKNAQKYKK